MLLLFLCAAPAWAELAAGKTAAHFALRTVPDLTKMVRSQELFAGKTTLLSFFAVWCRPCKSEIPELRSIAQRYADRGFQVVLISLDRDKEDIAPFLKSAGSGDLLVLWDKERWVKDLYQVTQLPTNVRVDPDGTVGASWFGYLPKKLELLESHLRSLPKLSGTPPPTQPSK